MKPRTWESIWSRVFLEACNFVILEEVDSETVIVASQNSLIRLNARKSEWNLSVNELSEVALAKLAWFRMGGK